MRYVVANKEKALDAGVLLLGHLVKGESIILNQIISEGGWEYGRKL